MGHTWFLSLDCCVYNLQYTEITQYFLKNIYKVLFFLKFPSDMHLKISKGITLYLYTDCMHPYVHVLTSDLYIWIQYLFLILISVFLRCIESRIINSIENIPWNKTSVIKWNPFLCRLKYLKTKRWRSSLIIYQIKSLLSFFRIIHAYISLYNALVLLMFYLIK